QAGLVACRALFSLSVPTPAASIPAHSVRSAWTRVSIDAASVGSQARAAAEAKMSRMASRMGPVWRSGGAESNSRSVLKHLEAYARHSAAKHVQHARGFPGEIDDAAASERPAVVDAHRDGAPIVEIGHAHTGAERKL